MAMVSSISNKNTINNITNDKATAENRSSDDDDNSSESESSLSSSELRSNPTAAAAIPQKLDRASLAASLPAHIDTNGLSEYELLRLNNIQRNEAKLASLGLFGITSGNKGGEGRAKSPQARKAAATRRRNAERAREIYENHETWRRNAGRDAGAGGDASRSSATASPSRSRPSRAAASDRVSYAESPAAAAVPITRIEVWRAHLADLKDFRAAFGHYRVTRTVQDGKYKRLSDWLGRQRLQYLKYKRGEKSSLNEERVRLLEGLEGNWWRNKKSGRVVRYGGDNFSSGSKEDIARKLWSEKNEDEDEDDSVADRVQEMEDQITEEEVEIGSSDSYSEESYDEHEGRRGVDVQKVHNYLEDSRSDRRNKPTRGRDHETSIQRKPRHASAVRGRGKSSTFGKRRRRGTPPKSGSLVKPRRKMEAEYSNMDMEDGFEIGSLDSYSEVSYNEHEFKRGRSPQEGYYLLDASQSNSRDEPDGGRNREITTPGELTSAFAARGRGGSSNNGKRKSRGSLLKRGSPSKRSRKKSLLKQVSAALPTINDANSQSRKKIGISRRRPREHRNRPSYHLDDGESVGSMAIHEESKAIGEQQNARKRSHSGSINSAMLVDLRGAKDGWEHSSKLSSRKRKRNGHILHPPRHPLYSDDGESMISMVGDCDDDGSMLLEDCGGYGGTEEERRHAVDVTLSHRQQEKNDHQFRGDGRNHRRRGHGPNRPAMTSLSATKPMDEIIIGPSSRSGSLVDYEKKLEVQGKRDKLMAEYGRLYQKKCSIFERKAQLVNELQAIQSYIAIFRGDSFVGGNGVGITQLGNRQSDMVGGAVNDLAVDAMLP